MSSLHRQRFFDKMVHMEAWKNTMSGKNEKRVLEILELMGYKLGEDFVRQHPIGEAFVIDFAFVKEQVALEVDGDDHLTKKKRKMDTKRDSYLRANGWIPIRILDRHFQNTYRMSFYKNLIKDIVAERNAQWEVGELYAIDIPNYNEVDYE